MVLFGRKLVLSFFAQRALNKVSLSMWKIDTQIFKIFLLKGIREYKLKYDLRSWQDAQVIACAHAITHTNKEKQGLPGQWKASPKVKLCGLISPT